MVAKNLSMKNVMSQIVPITRFNRGEANKIFDELKDTGVKAVLKNNVRVGVLVEPEQYDDMVELLEDYAMFFEAERRMQKAETEGFFSQKEVMEHLHISQTDLDDNEDVEIE